MTASRALGRLGKQVLHRVLAVASAIFRVLLLFAVQIQTSIIDPHDSGMYTNCLYRQFPRIPVLVLGFSVRPRAGGQWAPTYFGAEQGNPPPGPLWLVASHLRRSNRGMRLPGSCRYPSGWIPVLQAGGKAWPFQAARRASPYAGAAALSFAVLPVLAQTR